jgi:hypothetical protein
MGCNTCRSECGREDGCGTRKAEQKDILDALVARLYPSRSWGDAEPEASLAERLELPEVVQLASRLATALRTPAYVLPGGDEDLCAFIYVLCLGREPSILELRDGAAGRDFPIEADTLRERYLRIACSQMGRLACVQEVALELSVRGDDCPSGMAVIREVPLPGVFTPALLKRFQRTVDLLQAHGIEHLDMGLLDVEASAFGLLAGDYVERFGTSPALVNYLFYAAPVQTLTTTFVPLPGPLPPVLTQEQLDRI